MNRESTITSSDHFTSHDLDASSIRRSTMRQSLHSKPRDALSFYGTEQESGRGAGTGNQTDAIGTIPHIR